MRKGLLIKNKKKFILGTLIAVFIIYLLVRQIDLEKIKDLSIKIDFYLLSVAFLLLVVANLVRAARFNYVLNKPISLKEMFRVTSFYNLYTALLPGGVGELSLIYLLKKKIKNHISLGLSSIVITRIYDILIIMALFLVGLFMVGNIEIDKSKSILIMGPLIVALLLIIKYIHKIVEKLGQLFLLLAKQSAWAHKVVKNLKEAAIFLESNQKKKLPLFITSFFFWLITFWTVQLLFWAVGIHLDFWGAVVVGTLANLIMMIPINTLGGFGYQETGVALGLIFLGIVKSEAVIYSFIYHLLVIGVLLGLALVGFMLGLNFRKKSGLIN